MRRFAGVLGCVALLGCTSAPGVFGTDASRGDVIDASIDTARDAAPDDAIDSTTDRGAILIGTDGFVATDASADASSDAVDVGLGCVGASGMSSPRLIAPLSTATVTSQRPSLHWLPAPGACGAHVEICSDRACAHVEQSFDATGTSHAPDVALGHGVHYWHARAPMGTAYGPTWEFWVGARSAAVDTSWGTTVDVNGDGYADVIVGTLGSNTVSIYEGGARGLATTPATLRGPDGSSQFGASVESAGDFNGDGFSDVVVGAPVSNTAYIYFGGASGLATTPTTITNPGVTNAFFGASVASAGDVNGDGYADVIVGPGVPPNATAYVYLGGQTGLASTPTPIAATVGLDAVASAGDVNGDGYADVILGDRVFAGSVSGLAATPTILTAPGAIYFGESVASAGDINGDGYADVIIGAPNSHTAYVFVGGASGLARVPTTLHQTSAGFGSAVAGAGDVDGDGYADVIVGAGDSLSSDAAYVYVGGAGGLADTPMTVTGPSHSSYGSSVAGAGDVNGDGYAEIIVGAPSGNAAYVSFGGATGIDPTPTTLAGPPGDTMFGTSVASTAAPASAPSNGANGASRAGAAGCHHRIRRVADRATDARRCRHESARLDGLRIA